MAGAVSPGDVLRDVMWSMAVPGVLFPVLDPTFWFRRGVGNGYQVGAYRGRLRDVDLLERGRLRLTW